MKLFLDDMRVPADCLKHMGLRIGDAISVYHEEWTVVRTFEEFTEVVTEHARKIKLVSFDHDLYLEHHHPNMFVSEEAYNKLYDNFKFKTGYDCAQWMHKHYGDNGLSFPKIIVHSMNPVGTRNIEKLFGLPLTTFQQ